MFSWLVEKFLSRYEGKTPSEKIKNFDGDPYLERFFLFPKNRFLNIYLHHFVGDDTRSFHDHPWYSIGFLLKGSYQEMTPYWQPNKKFARITSVAEQNHSQVNRTKMHTPGSLAFRSSKFTHYILCWTPSIWTIFITGPNSSAWGFYDADGVWRDHKLYIDKNTRRN